MASTLKDKKVLVVGSGLARAITQAARAAGATVIVAGRDPDGLAVNAISPGVVDTGAWDALGEAAILAMTNTFMTGLTLHVDGGERLT
jgi:NAD(P)-dependent dehydrogenase (short-subunit alcohol dehydrogenase family)